MPAPRSLILLLTHGVALMAGWVLFSGSRGTNETEHSSSVRSQERVAPRPDAQTWSAAEILRKVDSEPLQFEPIPPDEEKRVVDSHQELRDELAKSNTSAIEALQQMLALANEAEQPGSPPVDHNRIRALLDIIGQDQGPLPLVSFLDQSSGSAGEIRTGIRNAFALDPSYDKARQLKEALQPEEWQMISRQLNEGWPPGRRDELLQLAVEENLPGILASGSNTDRSAWLGSLMSDSSLPDSFRKKLQEDPAVRSCLIESRNVPLDVRIDSGETLQELARVDLLMILKDTPTDWIYRFKSGQSTADEVLAAIGKETPELAAAGADELRSQVFMKLAEWDPDRARDLLAGMPEEQKSSLMNRMLLRFGYAGGPDNFMNLVQAIPPGSEQSLLAWEFAVMGFTSTLNGYADWAEAMPPGPDRDQALYGLVTIHNVKSDPATTQRLAGQIQDSKLRQEALSTP